MSADITINSFFSNIGLAVIAFKINVYLIPTVPICCCLLEFQPRGKLSDGLPPFLARVREGRVQKKAV